MSVESRHFDSSAFTSGITSLPNRSLSFSRAVSSIIRLSFDTVLSSAMLVSTASSSDHSTLS